SRFFLVSLIKAVEAISPFRLPVTSDLIDSGFKYRYFSSSKAEKETGFRIKIPFKKTITDTLLWYKKTGLLK
ncbi:MAG: hypothetical protein KKH98_12080, partial [Spirochaetes bacterium]|nr:hypothetical protein [Spirochaetota bacterium]